MCLSYRFDNLAKYHIAHTIGVRRTMLDRVTGMQVFTRVAALGSLSAAARALGMSQTMATKHLAAVEERLGVKLLHRTTRRLTLTEAGRHYLDAAERILA
jgi:DNA-binding transcriptional LysR family regulator